MPKEAVTQAKEKHYAMHEVPTDLNREGVAEISGALRQLLADSFALYIKTKNFHRHMTGQHFRDYHLLLDEQSEQIFAMTDDIAARAQDWRNHLAFHQRHLQAPALEGQQ
jgi:starvation-inducible DNA-binding protein